MIVDILEYTGPVGGLSLFVLSLRVLWQQNHRPEPEEPDPDPELKTLYKLCTECSDADLEFLRTHGATWVDKALNWNQRVGPDNWGDRFNKSIDTRFSILRAHEDVPIDESILRAVIKEDLQGFSAEDIRNMTTDEYVRLRPQLLALVRRVAKWVSKRCSISHSTATSGTCDAAASVGGLSRERTPATVLTRYSPT